MLLSNVAGTINNFPLLIKITIQGTIGSGGNIGIASGAGAGTYSAAILQQDLWQNYLHGGSIRPDTTVGEEILSMASSAIGAGVGALTGAAVGEAGASAAQGSSAAASSTIYNQDAPEDEEAERPAGPDGEPLTDQQIVDEHDYYAAYNELKAIDPSNPALDTLTTQNWVPSEQDAAQMQQALVTAQEINTLNTTAQGQQTLLNDAPVGTESVAQADQAALKAQQAVANRVLQRQSQLPASSQGRVTMGVGILQDGNGNQLTVVSTSEPNGYLRQA